MPTCPSSLEELSLDCMIGNVRDFVEHGKDGGEEEEMVNVLVEPSASSPPEWAPIPAEVGNKLLNKVRERGLLNQHSLKFFTCDRVRLTEVDLTGCEVSLDSLRALAGHRLEALSLFRTKIANSSRLDLLALIDDCLDAEVPERLRRLNVGGPEPIERLRMLSRFSALTSLVVAESPVFDSAHLRIVCSEMHHLRCLDISKTPVNDISCVQILCDCLEALIMHRVHIWSKLQVKTLAALKSLRQLRSLDVSDRRTESEGNDDTLGGRLADRILTASISDPTPWWPDLESFDFSGNELVSDTGLDSINVRLGRFIALHPKLRFVGVLDTAISSLPFLARINHLQIAGSASRVQCIQSVLTYWRPDREAFTAHALQSVYYELQSAYDDFDANDISCSAKGIELSMRHHRTNLSVQMAGSACLYHLCRFQRGKALSSEQIRLCVDRCLDAAESHPKIIQLQKNVWLTLCNDYLLQTKNFDMCRTCEVAMEAMVNTRDPSVSRMTIAIVSILAPKIPTERSHALATNVRYIRYLIDVINEKLSEQSTTPENNHLLDFTLKFTLSALWNLTDESPETCELFLKQGGLHAVLQALTRFNTSMSIQTKVLGLLNNVAEVPTLQTYMIEPFCLRTILELLENDKADANGNRPRIDVSYFAAGILANLLTAPAWIFEPSAEQCNRTLVEAVERWGTPENTMVAYRSFSPFYPLLQRDDLPGSQLWAVWAVRHVCSKDKERGYLQMLRAQNGYEAVSRVCWSPFASPSAKRIADDVLRLLENIPPAQSPPLPNRSFSHRQ